MLQECFVDSWRRKVDQNGKEFISFRINLKLENGEENLVEKRYSEFYKLHQEVMGCFDDKKQQRLKECFPSKSPLSLQTDLFADRRSKALDAYLQVLMHFSRDDDGILREFFGLKSEPKESKKSPKLKTPNVFDAEIDKLRMKLFSCKDLKLLTDDFDRLQMNLPAEDSKSSTKFYELKREWEVMKIKSGQFDQNSFDIKAITSTTESKELKAEGLNRNTVNKNPDSTVINSSVLGQTKSHLREQEAILSDLADTLQQQKQLSLEICEEILQQNREIGEFGRKQEGTIGDFIQSTEKARKLQ